MNMNKTLLAFALATAGLSANVSALTFAQGNLTGKVDIGGTITVPLEKWLWSTGGAVMSLDSTVNVMTNAKKTLTISMTQSYPLLVGHSKAEIPGSAAPTGITPTLSIKDAENNAVTVNYIGNGNGAVTLPVFDSSNATLKLGNATIAVKSAAGILRNDTVTNKYDTISVLSAAASVLAGGLTDTSGFAVTTPDYAIDWAETLGAPNKAALLAQLSGSPTPGLTKVESVKFIDPKYTYAGSYGLGIPNGSDIVVSFTKPITATTAWKASLNMTVAHI